MSCFIDDAWLVVCSVMLQIVGLVSQIYTHTKASIDSKQLHWLSQCLAYRLS